VCPELLAECRTRAPRASAGTALETLSARSITVPTDGPEADGTLEWDSTTVVIVEARAGAETGLGYTYASDAAVGVITSVLADELIGLAPLSPQAAWARMRRAVRNIGYPGVASSAISAVDIAMWDLKARLLGVPLSTLLGRVRDVVPVYGSGGFTTYDQEQLERQLGGWVRGGINAVKIKVGSEPDQDLERVREARRAIGERARLFVDANGAYQRKQALDLAEAFAREANVSWFEEPVSSDDLEGLRLLRDRAPAGMKIAAGEYGYDLFYFRRMLEAGAVDVLQADVTRCGGVTQMLRVSALCEAFATPLSAHTAPAVHAHVCAALVPLEHVEYFHDHARLEQLLFDGAPQLVDGALCPDAEAPGLALSLSEQRFGGEDGG
jgi:L-alanine-DL-glutamate epimerase-like enolase superfamily enzyme